jgi:glyoxylase-like metal-dependent hydrolase (beta-lactamase superfamily II)
MKPLTWQIGDVRITRIVEHEMSFPLAGLLAEAVPEALSRHRHWLAPSYLDDDGNCTLSIHALLVESCGRRIVVDTCIGEHRDSSFGSFELTPGPFLDDIAAAGFPRESVDVVLCTHMHFDHVGWNTLRMGDRFVPTFPNARYLFAREEWEHWSALSERAFAEPFDETVTPILEAGLADRVETNHRVTDEVTLVPTPGHTPGHVSVAIESAGQRALITGDATHHPVQWAEPDWGVHADADPALAAATRRRLTREYENGPTCIIGTHYPAPCSGRIVSGAAGVRFESDPR